MFIKNHWYVAGWSNELSGVPFGRTFLNEPVVLYRTDLGRAVAMEDRCCHRNLPLSMGVVQGETIVCGYHGLVYNCAGQCIHVPGQEQIPKEARVRTYPLVEHDGVLWIWMGQVDLADETRIVRYPFHSDPKWAYQATHYQINCHYELINDNLLDLSHVGYVHQKTIGGTPGAHSDARLVTERVEDSVIVRRWMQDTVPPPTYQRNLGFKGRIDRWMEITFVLGLIRIYIGANDAGVGLDEAEKMDKLGIRIFNGITPETDKTTHYFWTAAHNFNVNDPAVTAAFHGEIAATFEEDRQVVEAQQRRFDQLPDRKTIAIRSDLGTAQARRMLHQRMQQEITEKETSQ
jgi:phenylpropionate dioxygenase-like ring-hydroxylating dioxygenase large terminal subunit